MNKLFTILLVDDEESNINFIVNCLKNSLYEFKVAYDGITALKILDKFSIDLILLDIKMPNMDGYDVAKEINLNEKLSQIPYIFLTALKDDHSLINGFKLGARDYITKPFRIEELKVRIQNHIKLSQLMIENNKQQSYIKDILNSQSNMIILSDTESISFANKRFLDFFSCSTIEEFKKKYICISNLFVENDLYFYKDKTSKDINWIEQIQKENKEDRVVALFSSKSLEIRAFKISISVNEFDTYIISFSDISENILLQRKLEDRIIHDSLTGAFNREYFKISHKKEIKKAKDENKKLAIAILDLDLFKNINDNYGHDIGDNILKEFVEIANHSLREEDIFIRWGGEEFLAILKISQDIDLENILNELRVIIENYSFKVVKDITCSIGGAIHINSESIEKTIKRADEALYYAKSNGRNQISIK